MRSNTREWMISTAARLLQQRGYHGTSLNDILTESRAPRGSLYFHFPGGKDELVVEATRATIGQTTSLLADLLARAETPGRAVREFVEGAAEMLRRSNFALGCPVAPIILDGADASEEIKQVCREAFDAWIGLYRKAFAEAGLSPEGAETLACSVEATIEGLLLIAKAYRDVTPMLRSAVELEASVDAAIAAQAGDRAEPDGAARPAQP